MDRRLRRQAWVNFAASLPFLLFVLISVLLRDGYAVDDAGVVTLEAHKYGHNLTAQPILPVLLLVGLVLVIRGVWVTARSSATRGIWCGGLGTVFVGLVVLLLPAYNGTAFYPSTADIQSSLTIHNASSTHVTLTAMTYVALAIPFVVAYIAFVWRSMNRKRLQVEDVQDKAAY